MKNLIFINGTMGVGKTTACSELQKILSPSIFLDGDWCWNMNPFIVTEENGLFTLTISEQSLQKRLAGDISKGIRTNDAFERSYNRLPYYKEIDSVKIDVSKIDAKETARTIAAHIV